MVNAALATCPDGLSPEQIAQYQRDGFIALRNVLSPAEVEAAKAALTAITEALRGRHRVTQNGYGEVWASPDNTTKIQFLRGHEPTGENDPALHQKVRKFHDFVGVDEHLTYLMREQPKIQGVLASLLGPHPIPSQDMALVNPPLIGSGKPWHQDDAYFNIVPLDAVCGVWIALDEAGTDNGCMHFLPGWHLKGALRHFHSNDCEILADRLIEAEQVAVPLPPGGAVFFSGVLPHHTYPNTSPRLRRALQYHYRAHDSRRVSDAEYDAIFAEADGSPASCRATPPAGCLTYKRKLVTGATLCCPSVRAWPAMPAAPPAVPGAGLWHQTAPVGAAGMAGHAPTRRNTLCDSYSNYINPFRSVIYVHTFETRRRDRRPQLRCPRV